MHLPNFTFFNVYSAALVTMSAFAIAKIITLDWKFHLKESVYLVAATLIATVGSALARDFHNFFFQMFRDIIIFLLLVIYFHKVKFYTFKKAMILMIATSYILGVSIHIMTIIFYELFPNFNSHFIPRTGQREVVISWPEFLHLSLLLLVSALLAIGFVKGFGRFRIMMKRSTYFQTILLWVGTGIILTLIFLFSWMRHIGYRFYFTNWAGSPYLLIITLFFILFSFSLLFVNNKHEVKLKEERYMALQRYSQDLEQQQNAMRKFKHDYQNILLSLDSFIVEKKWNELEDYYNSKIKPTSAIITSNEFALEALSKIKVNEIKSLFTAKLIVAQNMGIDATFEAHEEIESIPVDSISLVRMLGIILDNAIEAVVELGEGMVKVAYFRDEADIVFIVQNTCPLDLRLRDIEQPGFSTKGKGRGQGLANLTEIADSCHNVTREMGIQEGVFTQKIIISYPEG